MSVMSREAMAGLISQQSAELPQAVVASMPSIWRCHHKAA